MMNRPHGHIAYCIRPSGGPKQTRTNGQRQADAELTAGSVDFDRFIWLDECVRALLAHAVLSTECHPVSDGEGFTEEVEQTSNNHRKSAYNSR